MTASLRWTSPAAATHSTQHPAAPIQMVMDSLRYWVGEMHVDGFRFDLAVALAREPARRASASTHFFACCAGPAADLESEADRRALGPGARRLPLGAFPGRLGPSGTASYRDSVRRFWRGDQAARSAKLATRLAGSNDLFEPAAGTPFASINFVTCHDGFTLRDLVSYEPKAQRRPTARRIATAPTPTGAATGAMRAHRAPECSSGCARRLAIATLLLTLAFSQGVPMLSHGDELGAHPGRQQQRLLPGRSGHDLGGLGARRRTPRAARIHAQAIFAIRRESPVLRRRGFFTGRPVKPLRGNPDLRWLRAEGGEFEEADWQDTERRHLGSPARRRGDGRCRRIRGRQRDG